MIRQPEREYLNRLTVKTFDPRQQNSRPPTGIAPRLGVGCQSFTLPSSVNYNWDKGCNGATLRFTVLSYHRLRHSSSSKERFSLRAISRGTSLMSWARNGLALAPLPHEDTPPFGTLRTPLPWPDRQDRQHLRSADGSFAGHSRVEAVVTHRSPHSPGREQFAHPVLR